MNLIRVFPRRTSMTPTDALAFVGNPPLDRPEADEVHVSVAFTWDIPEARRLVREWERFYPGKVKIGGPALGTPLGPFVSGRYLVEGVTFTTRGCDNRCPWCLVPPREGSLVELPEFAPGYIIQDNNLLQAGPFHIIKVMEMLRHQRRAAVFSGGLQASLVDDFVVGQFRGIRINSVFLAADTSQALRPLEASLDRLFFLGRKKLRVYTLIGFGGETIPEAEGRLERVWDMGGLPFAQLYQPADHWINYPREWRDLAKKWSRPAAMVASHNPKPQPVTAVEGPRLLAC